MKFSALEKLAGKRLTVSLPFLAFATAIIIINPLGEFPLFDDWSFARTVLNYQETGKMKICGWASMTLVLQSWWGILWTNVFGFSFTVLRFSTILCAFAFIGLFYKMLDTQHKDCKMASIFCFVLIFNPIFFLCSLSFMTDIPFLVMMMLSCSYFYSFLDNEKINEFLAAIIFCFAALLIRQLAVIIPFSFIAAWLFKKGFSIKNLLFSLIPLTSAVIILKIYNVWYYSTQEQSNLYGARELDLLFEIKSNLLVFLIKIILSSFTYLFYAGLFLLPAIMTYIFKIRNNKMHFLFFIRTAIVLSILMLAVNLFINIKYPFENVISILSSNGPGLYMIFDGENYLQEQNLTYKWILRIFIIIGAAGTSGLLIILYDYVKQGIFNPAKYPKMIFVMLLLISNTMLISTGIRFDRYLLTIFPLLLFIIYCSLRENPATNKNITLKAFILIIPLIVYTVAGTSHYFAWNKARWKGLYWLVDEKKIAPENIDGGFEFNGWYCFNPTYKETKENNWYWVQNNMYVIAFNQNKRYTIERPLPYFNILKLKNDSLFVLKKINLAKRPDFD